MAVTTLGNGWGVTTQGGHCGAGGTYIRGGRNVGIGPEGPNTDSGLGSCIQREAFFGCESLDMSDPNSAANLVWGWAFCMAEIHLSLSFLHGAPLSPTPSRKLSPAGPGILTMVGQFGWPPT